MKTPQFRHLPLVLALQAIFAGPMAHAATFTVSSGTDTTPKTVTTGETGTVSSGATLASGSGTTAVAVTGTAGTVSINNSGTIQNTSTGRAIDNDTSGVAIVITNTGTITAIASDALRLNKANSTLVLDNYGMISVTGAVSASASGQALDLRGASGTGAKTVNNGSTSVTSAVISSSNDDALRPGTNTTINNYGTIISTSTVNTKCPDYLGASCSTAISAHDGIDAGSRTGVVVNNYGTISGARHGITADTSITVTNNAGGQIIGRNGSGVGSDGTATVVNYGLISGRYAGAGKAYDQLGNGSSYTDPTLTTVNNGDGDGVDIDGIGTVTNYGRIEGLGGGGYDSGGRPNGGDGLALGGGTVVNQVGAVIWGDSNGILVDDGANGTDTTNLAGNKNRGTSTAAAGAVTISNYGQITGNKKVAIGLVGDWNDTVVNYATGVITGGANTLQVDKLSTDPTQTAGAAIQMGAGNDTLINYGRIEGKNGLAIDMGSGDDTVKLFGGTVIGTIDGGSGNNTLETDGNQSFEAGKLSNFQNYIVRGGNTVFNYGLGTVSSVQVDAGGALRVEGALATTGNLRVDGTFQATNAQGVRTINVGGNYNQGASGVLEVGVSGQSSADKLAVAGTATLTNGATIRPVARGYVAEGASYTVISAGTLTATPASLNVTDTAMIDYSLSSAGNNLVVSAHRTSTTASLAPSGLGSFGAALDALGKSGNASSDSLFRALDNLGSAGEVGEAIRQIAPNNSGGGLRATQLAGDTLLNTLGNRIDSVRSGGKLAAVQRGVAAGDEAGRRMWVEGTGAWGSQQERAGSSGYSLGSGGIAFGFEADRSLTDVMGVSVGYAQARASGAYSAGGDDTRVGTVHVGGYWSHSATTLTHDASLILGYSDYSTRRNVVFSGFGETLKGNTQGWNVSARYEAGLPFALTPALGARLLGGVRLGYLNAQGYTEEGGAAAQRVDGMNAYSFQSVLGGEMTYQFSETAQLQVRSRYLHEFADSPEVKASLAAGGPSFTLPGVKPNRDALQFGLAFRKVTEQGAKLGVAYDAEAREKYLVHQLTARVEWAF